MKTLRGFYYDALDRVWLNESKSCFSKEVKQQIIKDKTLIKTIEEVFNNPLDFDVDVKKDDMRLIIEKMTDNQNNYFNRINIEL